MTTGDVRDPVRELVQAAVDSYEKLYVLEALWSTEGPLDIDVICERVRLPLSIVQEVLEALWQTHLVQMHSRASYEYDRSDAHVDAVVGALIDLLAQDPLELSRIMDRAAIERARSALHARLSAGYAHQRLRR